MATVEDLYRQVLGREPEPEGLAFWQNAFGGSVDPMEQASFMQAAQAELARRTPAEQAVLAPKLFAESTATGVPVTTVAASVPPPAAPVDPTVKLYQDTLGRTPTQEEIDSWNFGSTIDAGELDRFLGAARNEAVNTMPTTGAAGNIASEILAQGTTDKWGGEGFGSAQKNAYDMGVMLAGQGLTSINDFGQRTTADGNKEFFNKATGEAIKPYYDKAAKVGPDVWGGTFAGKDSTAYGVQFDAAGKPLFYSQYGGDSSDVPSWVQPALSLAAAYFAPGLGNALLGAGASQVAAGALGGGLLGGGLAAVTGQDVLKGALTGGIGGAIAGYFSPTTGQVTTTPTADSIPFSYDDLGIDYSLANGTQMKPLTDMGGAQGLQAGTSANLANMGGAQGLTLNLGPASTTLANALSTFGGMNPANLDAMGGAQGLTYQTPTGLVTQGGVIPIGGMTGNNNVIGETGINTAYNIGNGIGSNLAAVDTGVYNPTGGLLSSTVTGINPDGTPVTPTTTTTPPIDITKIPPSLITAILGAVVAPKVLNPTTPTPMGVGALPTQGVPLNTADYYTAIQQNYNRLLPAVPRDVATPLAQWYNSTYGA